MLRLLGRPWAFRRVLGMAGGGLRYLLRDEFTTDRAAGAVNGTAAEPGPGTRVVVDTENKLSISGGAAVFAGGKATPAAGDPGLWYDSQQREPGRILKGALTFSAANALHYGIGWDASQAGLISNSFAFGSTGNLTVYENGSSIGVITSYTANAYELSIVLRAAGQFYFYNVGTSWLLAARSSAANTTPLYPGISGYANNPTANYIRVPNDLWLPTPLVSDGYGSAYGTSDGLGHAEGVAAGIGAGGAGVTWSNGGATWSVAGGKAVNTAPSGIAQELSVANLACADVLLGAAITRATSAAVGLILRCDSATNPQNYVKVYSDGAGNIKVDKIIGGGAAANVSTTAFTYSAGARLICSFNGSALRTYYNNTLVKADTIADAALLTPTYHGIYSDGGAHTHDDTIAYAVGTSGEYATLNNY